MPSSIPSSSTLSKRILPSSSSSYSLLLLLTIHLVQAQQSVYVPGPVDDTPGANLVEVGAGVDGYTTYLIEGVTLQENSASAIMTQYDTNGVPVVYNCALGPDAQASCSVVQGNGVAYAYTEPITFFGQTTGQLPAAYNTPTTSAPLLGGGATSAPAAGASSTPSSSTPTSTPTTSNTRGPQAGAQQQTASNVFGADDTNGAASAMALDWQQGKMVALGAGIAAIVAGMML